MIWSAIGLIADVCIVSSIGVCLFAVGKAIVSCLS